jgi:hypothetical protein
MNEAAITQISPGTATMYELHMWLEYVTSGPIGDVDYAFCDYAVLFPMGAG